LNYKSIESNFDIKYRETGDKSNGITLEPNFALNIIY